MNKIYNVGDSGLIDGGAIVIEDNIGYYIYTCNVVYDAEKDYYITSDYIFKSDLDDVNSWMDIETVKHFVGYEDSQRSEMLVLEVIYYHGTQAPYDALFADEDEARDFMQNKLKEEE